MLDRLLDDRIALSFAAIAASAERNRLYAALARKQGDLQRARLLDAIARAEKTQASRLLMALRGNIEPADTYYSDLMKTKLETSATDAPRIQDSFGDETGEFGPEFFGRLARVSKNHFRLLEKNTQKQADRETAFYVCGVCGFIAVDQTPDKCPICNAVPKKFTAVLP